MPKILWETVLKLRHFISFSFPVITDMFMKRQALKNLVHSLHIMSMKKNVTFQFAAFLYFNAILKTEHCLKPQVSSICKFRNANHNFSSKVIYLDTRTGTVQDSNLESCEECRKLEPLKTWWQYGSVNTTWAKTSSTYSIALVQFSGALHKYACGQYILNWCYTQYVCFRPFLPQPTSDKIRVSTRSYYCIHIWVRSFSCLKTKFFCLGFFHNAIDWIPLLRASWQSHNSRCNVGITHLCSTFTMGWESL
jgi:hypothetical protein